MLEFSDTPTYQVSKQAQSFQSKVGEMFMETQLL